MAIPIDKSFADIRTELFSRISAVQEDGYLPSVLNLNRGPVRGLIELWGWGLHQLYSFLKAVLKQAFPESATGGWLNLHCSQVGVTRLAATKARGVVYFTREDSGGNVAIPAGRVVKTKPDGLGDVYRYVTLDDAVLADGLTEVAVPVTAEEYGRGANAAAGMITEISTVISGVDAVENRSGWLTSEGADQETDDDLRERYRLAWLDVNGATKYAYESWARSVSGVIAAAIIDDHPRGQGTVDVVIRGSAGLPTEELITAVDAVVQENRPINDDVLVKGPTAISLDIVAELVLVSGTADNILNQVKSRINAIFTDPPTLNDVTPLNIGEDLTRDRLTAVIMAVSGIKRINWASPAGDVSAEADELIILNSLTLTYSWAAQP